MKLFFFSIPALLPSFDLCILRVFLSFWRFPFMTDERGWLVLLGLEMRKKNPSKKCVSVVPSWLQWRARFSWQPEKKHIPLKTNCSKRTFLSIFFLGNTVLPTVFQALYVKNLFFLKMKNVSPARLNCRTQISANCVTSTHFCASATHDGTFSFFPRHFGIPAMLPS